jgi:drug/metabolite transporter (DMT)-like permease
MSDETALPPRRALVLTIMAMAFFAAQDTMVKVISDSISIWQLYLVRAVLVLGLITATMGLFRPMSGMRLLNPGWAALRSFFMAGAFLCFYLAMPFVSLSQAAAAFFTGPLWITLFGALINGEKVGPRRIIALILGFAGVLVIVEPWGDELEPMLLLPVGAAMSYALAIVITRARCVDDSAVALSLVQNVIFAQVALVGLLVVDMARPDPAAIEGYRFLLMPWVRAEPLVWAMVAATAVTHMVGAITLTHVYQHAEASRIAPLEYSYLMMVPAADYLIWGTAPTANTLSGMVLIALAGGFVSWREGQPVRPRPQTHGEEPV